jgi:hypothetical protein
VLQRAGGSREPPRPRHGGGSGAQRQTAGRTDAWQARALPDGLRKPETMRPPKQTLNVQQGRHCAALIDPSFLSVSDLGRDHRYDSERTGVYDKNVIAHEDVFIAAVLRSIFEDPSRTRRNVGGFHTPGNHTAETALAGCPGGIRTGLRRFRTGLLASFAS